MSASRSEYMRGEMEEGFVMGWSAKSDVPDVCMKRGKVSLVGIRDGGGEREIITYLDIIHISSCLRFPLG